MGGGGQGSSYHAGRTSFNTELVCILFNNEKNMNCCSTMGSCWGLCNLKICSLNALLKRAIDSVSRMQSGISFQSMTSEKQKPRFASSNLALGISRSLRFLVRWVNPGSIVGNLGSFSELRVKIVGTEVMQCFICDDSLIKGEQRLHSEPFTSPSVLIIGILC